MAAEDWCPEDSLNELRKNVNHYGFFAALRLVDCCAEGAPQTGWGKNPSAELLRLKQKPSMEFAASTLRSAGFSRSTDKFELSCNFLGLFGPQGALPFELTEFAMDRQRDFRDDTFVSFLDCFHHRMLSFFYRAYATTEPTIQYDAPEKDRFRFYVGSFAGINSETLTDRDEMPDLVKLHFAGHLGQQNHHADGLQSIVSGFFKLPVKINEFVGSWLEIPVENRLELGCSRQTGTLGVATTLGEKIWECQQTIRLVIGPVDLDEYLKFLPGEEYLLQLLAILKNYIGLALNWEVQVLVKRESVPSAQLGNNCQLGWSSWLAGDVPQSDAGDLVVSSTQL
ncbi:MAG: type VI secretion system baseplate subunit TssG [Pirellulales bacterium]|jgi:type VI secretion system protein ImpH